MIFFNNILGSIRMSDEINSNAEDVTRFNLTFSLDRDRFFRRTCPNCGRDFKTQIDEADLVMSLQPAFRQMGLEIGAEQSAEKEDEPKEHLYCPYCEYFAESSDMLTQIFVSYLQRYVTREFILPQINKMFSDFDSKSRSSGSRSKGFGIEMKLEYSKSVLPPRPISGPEPPDMIIVELLCCNKKIKIIDGYALNLCPYCGTNVILH